MTAVTLDSLDLAALLCSRVCHDVISPVGAIVNGLEVLDEEKDESMRGFAQDLIRKSARQASARLQFARIAFGAAGSAGSAIDTGDAEQVARGFIQDEKVTLDWQGARSFMPKNKVKLLLNLLVVATTTIPRGGSIVASIEGAPGSENFRIVTKGINARVPPHAEALLAGAPESGVVDAHGIQPFYAGMIARAANMSVTLALTVPGEQVLIEATPISV